MTAYICLVPHHFNRSLFSPKATHSRLSNGGSIKSHYFHDVVSLFGMSRGNCFKVSLRLFFSFQITKLKIKLWLQENSSPLREQFVPFDVPISPSPLLPRPSIPLIKFSLLCPSHSCVLEWQRLHAEKGR